MSTTALKLDGIPTWMYGLAIVFLGIAFYFYMYKLDDFQLKCVVSHLDGNKYCVRERDKLKESVDLLAQATENCRQLVEYVGKNHGDRLDVQRLVKNFNPKKIQETLPTSSYTAYSENKGEKIAFCLNTEKKGDINHLIDLHTLTFVAIHELSHVMTESVGHKSEFWENFKFLLQNAKEAGIHEPVDYSKKPKEYCSQKITDNPYFV